MRGRSVCRSRLVCMCILRAWEKALGSVNKRKAFGDPRTLGAFDDAVFSCIAVRASIPVAPFPFSTRIIFSFPFKCLPGLRRLRALTTCTRTQSTNAFLSDAIVAHLSPPVALSPRLIVIHHCSPLLCFPTLTFVCSTYTLHVVMTYVNSLQIDGQEE